MLNNRQVLESSKTGLRGRASRPSRVIVLGAGVSGLVAGRELVRAGHEVVVLEARSRAGGRIRTEQGPWSGGMKAELGAMRIPLSHKPTLDYIETLGLRTKPFPLTDPNAYHLAAGRLRRMRDLMPAELPLLRDLLQPFMDQARRGGTEWEKVVLEYDGVSMRDFLSNLGMSSEHLDAFSLMAGTDSLLCASAVELLRDALGGFFDTQALTIEGGMERFPETMARVMQTRIRYNTRVTALDQHDRGVVIHSDNGVFYGDFAVVTIPFSVLRYVDIRKPFSTAKSRAIRGLHYEPAAKLYFAFRRRFWEDEGIAAGVSYTDLPVRKLYYLREGEETGRGLLLSYCTGRDAQRWTALGEAAALEEGLRSIARLHPSAVDLFEGGVAKLWQSDPYAGGAFAFCQPYEEAQFGEPARTPEGRFYFAGEHTSYQRRWIQGALESGLRAAEDIHRRATQQEPPLWMAQRNTRSSIPAQCS